MSNLEPERQGRGIIMGVTRLLLLGPFYTIQTKFMYFFAHDCSLSESKVKPSFCFPFKIPDVPTATNVNQFNSILSTSEVILMLLPTEVKLCCILTTGYGRPMMPFSLKSRSFGLKSRQIGQINYSALQSMSPFSMFSIIQPLFLQKN